MEMPQRAATVPCTFCGQLNRIDLGRVQNRPQCGSCGRPILLDRPVRLTDADFDQVVAACAAPLLVDFYADWCAPCKIMAPAIDEIAHEHHGQVVVAKVDTDRSPATSMKLGIRSIPTIILFERGVEKTRQSGAMRREQIESLVGLGG